jgi:nucleotide-binding universal stress UspA family protein
MTGDADAGILQAIDNLKTNVVVMATHARGGVAGMMLGNTAERLLTALPCSALVIKPDDFQCPVSFS